MGDVLRSNHFSRNWSKRHDCVEHVTLNKFRAPAGVELCVLISIPHPGSLFVRQPNLPEHFGDGRVLGAELTQDAISGADALDALLRKGGAEVLLTKRNQTVVGLQQIDDINIPVIVLSR